MISLLVKVGLPIFIDNFIIWQILKAGCVWETRVFKNNLVFIETLS